MPKVTQQGGCQVRIDSEPLYIRVALYIRHPLDRAEFTNGDIGELESRLFAETCVHTDRLSRTDLHFDSRGS